MRYLLAGLFILIAATIAVYEMAVDAKPHKAELKCSETLKRCYWE
jgi:hypothetical protein